MDANAGSSIVASAWQRPGVSFRPGQSFTAWRLVLVENKMNITDYLSDDGQTMLALCSAVGLKDAAAGEDSRPLKLSEWNALDRQIRNSSIKTPAALQGRTADEIGQALALPLEEAERIVR